MSMVVSLRRNPGHCGSWQVFSLHLLTQGSAPLFTASNSAAPHTSRGRKTNLYTSPPCRTLEPERITMYQTSVLSVLWERAQYLLFDLSNVTLFPKAIMRFHVLYCDSLRVHLTEFLPLHMVFSVSMETRLI